MGDADGNLSFDPTVALAERAPSLEVGHQIGRTRVVSYLGRGGMGEVYEVEHTRLGKHFALKIILPELARERGFVERFEREARLTARLEHPGVIRVDDFGEDEGLCWIRMELAGGAELARLLGPEHAGRARSLSALARAAKGRLSERFVAEIATGTFEGLAFAHGRGVVHRDLKPGNVLLTEGPRGELVPKVSDFGLARVVGEGMLRSLAEYSVSHSVSEGRTRPDATTSAVSLVGTYEYMSPEQRRGEPAGPASDVYAAGLVMYRLLTGRHSPGFKKPSEVAEDLDPFWDEFLAKALEEEPGGRFPDAGEMLSRLKERWAPVGVRPRPRDGSGDVLAEALSARTEARKLQARARVMATRSEPALAKLLDEGETELSRGEAAHEEPEPGRALDHFARAGELFEGALGGAEAVEKCAESEAYTRAAERSAREMRADGFAPSDFDAAARASGEAARARAEGDFDRSDRLYREATRAFELAKETAHDDASARSKALSLRTRALSWKYRDEPALADLLECAGSAAGKIDAALDGRERDEAVRRAEEAGRLYEEALANGEVLREIVELEREAKAVADECMRLGADTHAPEDHAEGWALIGRAATRRAKGEFVGASAALSEALGKLGECRDACANVRARQVSKLVMIVLAVVIALAAGAILVGWLMIGREEQLGRTRPGSRAIRFYAYGIRPPRRHGGTENGHGVEVVSRTFSPWPQVWGTRERTATWVR